MNRKIGKISVPASLAIADQVRSMEAAGRRVIKLQTGDPDFSTPGPIVAAAHEAITDDATHYVDTRGLPVLRETIASTIARDLGLNYNPVREILITNGGSHAVFCSLQALLNDGDEVIVLEPCWPQYIASVLLAGGIPVLASCPAANGFHLDMTELSSAVTSRTRAIIMNSPNNPTGVALLREEIEAICQLSIERNLIVLSDEVYRTIMYDDAVHISPASCEGMQKRTIRIDSFSKAYAMTGWRLGYICAPAEMINAILKISQCSITNVNPAVQLAGVAALTSPDVESATRSMVEEYAQRRQLLIVKLDALGLKYAKPAGAFYFLIDISESGLSSVDFARELLQTEGVATVPGISYGDSSEGFVRISYATDIRTVLSGVDAIARCLKTSSV